MLWTLIKTLFGWSKKPTTEYKNFKKLSINTQRAILEKYVKKD